MRAPWKARRSSQSVLKEINLNIHWRDWCWSWSSNTLATWYKESNSLKRPWCWERWLDSITNSTDMNLSKLQEIVEDRGASCATVHGITKSLTQLGNWTTATTYFFHTGCSNLHSHKELIKVPLFPLVTYPLVIPTLLLITSVTGLRCLLWFTFTFP